MRKSAEVVSVIPVDDEKRARRERIQKRREDLGMNRSALAREAGVSRSHYSEYESGSRTPDEPWLRKVENALTRLERTLGHDEPEPSPDIEVGPAEDHGGYIRFELQGVYGAKAMIVSAPVGNPEELATAVDLIMRRLREDEASGSTDEA